MNWVKHNNKYLHTETGMVVKKRDGGWGKEHNPTSQRTWAILEPSSDGNVTLKASNGNTRSFASSDAAIKTAEIYISENF